MSKITDVIEAAQHVQAHNGEHKSICCVELFSFKVSCSIP